MNRFLLTLCSAIVLAVPSKAQLDTIPNAGFENWYYTPIWTIEASGWQSNNSSIAAWNVMPDSVSHTGLLGLKLQNISYRGVIWSGFPLSQHPITFDCYIKNGLNLGDTAMIQVHIYSSNIIVDSVYSEIYGGIGTSYLPFSFNISQNTSSADSCVITLTGGNMYLSSVSFDDLSFSFPTSTGEQESKGTWKIFPNPVSDKFEIRNPKSEIKEIEIYDVIGNKLISQQLKASGQKQLTVDISHLRSGIYLLTVSDGKTIQSIRFVKQ